MKNKKVLIVICLLLITFISVISYISYGYMNAKISGNEIAKKAVFNSEIVKVEYSDGLETLTSSQEYFVPGSTLTKTFIITNTGNVPVKYSINLTNIENEFDRSDDLTYELTSNDEILYSGMYETKGVFPKSDTYILSKDVLNIGESRSYTLKVNYLKSEENQIIDQGKVIKAKISIENTIKTIKSLKVYGNSVQETGKNLFDINNPQLIFKSTNNTIEGNKITMVSNQNRAWQGCGFILPETLTGKTVTFSFDYKVTNSNSNKTYVRVGYNNGSSAVANFNGYLISITGEGHKEITITYPEEFPANADKWVLYFNTSPEVYAENDTLEISNLQVEFGSTATEYEEYQYPTPDKPMPINSLGTEKNMFNINDFAETYNPYFSVKPTFETFDGKECLKVYGAINATGRAIEYMKGEFEENTQYTISLMKYDVMAKSSNGTYYEGLSMNVYYTDGTRSSVWNISDGIEKEWQKVVFTSSVGKTIDYIKLSYNTGSAYSYIYNMQIEEGINASEYVPHGKYVLPINVKGRNLLKVDGVYSWKIYVNGDYKDTKVEGDVIQSLCNNTSMRFNANAYYGYESTMIKLKPNTTYIYGVEYIDDEETDPSAYVTLAAYKPNQTGKAYFTSNKTTSNFIKTNNNDKDGYHKFTTNSTDLLYGFATVGMNASGSQVVKYRLYLYEVVNDEINPIYEKYTSKDYNIVLDEPLRSIKSCTNCVDYINFEDNEIVRYVKGVTFNGDETWGLQAINSYNIANFSSREIGESNKNNIISNRFTRQNTVIADTTTEGFLYSNATAFYIRINSSRASTVDGFKEWLKTNNVEINSQLLTPNYSDVLLPEIKTSSEVNNISVCSSNGVCASNIEIEYYE